MISPTPAELEILNVLWELGEANTQTVNERLCSIRSVGYTTTLKTMQVMTEKGYLDRRREGKSHVYFPAIQEHETKENLLNNFVKNTFRGSSSNLLMQLFGSKRVSMEEIEQIKDFLNSMEDKDKDNG